VTPGLVVLAINLAIVWYLLRTLRRERKKKSLSPPMLEHHLQPLAPARIYMRAPAPQPGRSPASILLPSLGLGVLGYHIIGVSLGSMLC